MIIGRLLLICFCILSVAYVQAQSTDLAINDTGSIEDIVKSLQGPSVEIFNITYSGDFKNKPVGAFNDVIGLLDINSGLIMTSGSAKVAIGPNNKADAGTTTNSNKKNDPNLELLVPNEDLYDLVVIEFDISVTNTVLSFNYLFGSEEYPEFEREYNDVFGFFISGPGITGIKNLAVLSNGAPVSVKSINSFRNSNFFVPNGTGSNPAKDFYLQYDGFTKKLTAQTQVIPCQTYHVKLAIADARDELLDSGVFIEKGSFTSSSNLDINVTFEHEEFDYAVEGCNKGYFIIKKDLQWLTLNNPVMLEYRLSGTSTNGIDYTSIAGNTITIPANEESIKMEIDALVDGIAEGSENVRLDIILRCGISIVATASADMIIKDEIEYSISSRVCKYVLMPINTQASNRWTFTWAQNTALSCTNCPSPSVNLSADNQFPVEVRDNISGCKTTTEAVVTIQQIEARFDYTKDKNYTFSDVSFQNLSVGADAYEWDFGDGQTSDAFEPDHTYIQSEALAPVTYKIVLKASALEGMCSAEYDTTVTVEPFFMPNVITPNDDALNDYFTVKGIEPGVWKLQIYNRWGTLVFKSDAYRNDWAGHDIASGVYYYKLINPPGDRELKGWIHVLK